MHAVGAALGTVISQLISVIVALFAIIKRKLIVIHRHHFKLHKKIIKDIFKIGFPISMQDGLIQISFIIITIIANSRGVDIAAAVGVVEKIISFLFLVPSSICHLGNLCTMCWNKTTSKSKTNFTLWMLYCFRIWNFLCAYLSIYFQGNSFVIYK